MLQVEVGYGKNVSEQTVQAERQWKQKQNKQTNKNWKAVNQRRKWIGKKNIELSSRDSKAGGEPISSGPAHHRNMKNWMCRTVQSVGSGVYPMCPRSTASIPRYDQAGIVPTLLTWFSCILGWIILLADATDTGYMVKIGLQRATLIGRCVHDLIYLRPNDSAKVPKARCVLINLQMIDLN